MNLHSEALQSKSSNIYSILCLLFSSLIFLVFFGYYTFAETDFNNRCYGQKVWSAAQKDYVSKITSYEVEGMLNADISNRFHLFFLVSFVLSAIWIVLVLGHSLYDYARGTSQNKPRTPCCTFIVGSTTILLLLGQIIWYGTGLYWRFSSFGELCSKEILSLQGYALKAFFVATLLIPCCPCAIILAFCF